MDGGVTTYLLTQGVLGVACIVLGFVVNKLYNKTESLQEENKVLYKQINDIIEAQRVEDKATTKEVLTVLQSNSQSNLVLAEKIETAKVRSRNGSVQ